MTLAPLLKRKKERGRKVFFAKIIAPLLATNKGERKNISRETELFKSAFFAV